MKAILEEYGDRPALMTAARLNAPQGGRALVDLFADEQWADLAIISLDWQGDGITPVVGIKVLKWFPEYDGQYVTLDERIDMEEAFGEDNMTRGILTEVVRVFEQKMADVIAARRARG